MSRRENLTDDQWALIEPLIPKNVLREDGKGVRVYTVIEKFSMGSYGF